MRGFNKATRHTPIIVEQESFTCAFVAKDLSLEKSRDNFLIILGHYDQSLMDNQLHSPKLLKFVRDGTYWKTAEYKFSNLTNFKGYTWDELRTKSRDFKEKFRNHL